MKVSIEEAINMASNGQSLEGVVIEDLGEAQVKAMDALMLAEQGIALPEQHIYYDDKDIAYDEDFDEVEWSKTPVQMTFEEKVAMSEQFLQAKVGETVSLQIEVPDKGLKDWVTANRAKVEQILGGLLADLYSSIRKG